MRNIPLNVGRFFHSSRFLNLFLQLQVLLFVFSAVLRLGVQFLSKEKESEITKHSIGLVSDAFAFCGLTAFLLLQMLLLSRALDQKYCHYFTSSDDNSRDAREDVEALPMYGDLFNLESATNEPEELPSYSNVMGSSNGSTPCSVVQDNEEVRPHLSLSRAFFQLFCFLRYGSVFYPQHDTNNDMECGAVGNTDPSSSRFFFCQQSSSRSQNPSRTQNGDYLSGNSYVYGRGAETSV